jgi:hypothetical protein
MLIFSAVFLASCAKIVVVKVPNSPSGQSQTSGMTEDGVFYALPKTVVRIAVKVDHITVKPAPFMKFAPIFAPGEQPVCKFSECTGTEKEKFELEQGASFSTFGEPDPDNVYMVKFVGDPAKDQMISMTWTETGLITKASASVTNRTTEIALSGLKLAANIGAKAAFGRTVKQKPRKVIVEVCPNPSKNDSWIISELKKENAEAQVFDYCNMNEGTRDKFVKSEDKSVLTQAAKAYGNYVQPLAMDRINLLSGSSQSMEPVEILNRLESLIAQRLAALYLGTKKKEVWEGSLEIRDLQEEGSVPVLHFDPTGKICFQKTKQVDLAPDSKPIPAKFKSKDCSCQNDTAVNMVINFYPNKEEQLFSIIPNDTSAKPSGDRSFRYRIPAQVKAELNYAGKTYGAGVFSVAQLGVVVSLPAEKASSKLQYDLTFLEATGGLKSFKLGTTGALDAATLDALSSAGGTILKSEQTANDEVTKLTRQSTILNLKDAICKIQKKYGQACTTQP